MKTKTQKIYVAEDGREFVTERECLTYELQKKGRGENRYLLANN